MSDTASNRPIKMEAVAAKLAAIRNFCWPEIAAEIEAEPRLVELLLFLQFVSQPENYAGGLDRFARDLIAASPDLLGTAVMREIGERALTAAQKREIYFSFPGCARAALGGVDSDAALLEEIATPCRLVEDWTSDDERRRIEEHRRRNDKREAECLRELSWQRLFALCQRRAEENLSRYLRELCELPHVRFRHCGAGRYDVSPPGAPWYFAAVSDAILRFIDRRAVELKGRIAETAITREMFKWLGTSRRTSRGVLISGNSRFGKTEALRTWCAMTPGTARLVNTPASSSESDLLREVAKAIWLEIGLHATAARLREAIDYVLTHTRLMLVFDEAHLIYPVSFSRNTAPARLNWIRRNVMDGGLPCAFIATPQSYSTAKKRFLKATGYAIEQFEERLLKTVELPAELPAEDLLAVAKIHFPGIDAAYLEYVVAAASATERNYVSDVEKIATLARINADDAGRTRPTLADIKAAIADVLPPAARTEGTSLAGRKRQQSAPAVQPAGRRVAAHLQAAGNGVSRSLQPAGFAPVDTPQSRLLFAADAPEETPATAGT